MADRKQPTPPPADAIKPPPPPAPPAPRGIVTVGRREGDELELTMTLRGDPLKVVAAVINGLPRHALLQLQGALAAELAKPGGQE